LLSLTSGGRKNKRTELDVDDRRLILCHAKLREKALVFPLAKMLGEHVPPVHFRFISQLRWWKNKRTEIDDRRLTLCCAKVGGDKSISVSLWQKCWGTFPPPSRFCALV